MGRLIVISNGIYPTTTHHQTGEVTQHRDYYHMLVMMDDSTLGLARLGNEESTVRIQQDQLDRKEEKKNRWSTSIMAGVIMVAFALYYY